MGSEISLFQSIGVFVAAFLVSSFLTPIFRNIALRLEIIDKPTQSHKTHSQPVPYLGGIAVLGTTYAGVFSISFFKTNLVFDRMELLILFLAPSILFIVGLIDDLKNLGPLLRLIMQTASGILVASIFISSDMLGVPSNYFFLNVLVTIVWVVGISNALNFIDNLDGGAAGISIISSAGLALAAILESQFAIAAIAFLLAGSVAGFLIWNFAPARIYLGDAGALFLGSLLSVLVIRFDPITSVVWFGWVFAFALLAVPILDTTLVVFSRIARGVSPTLGSKDHISHRLLSLGLSKRKTAYLIWLGQTTFAYLGLLLLSVPPLEGYLLSIVIFCLWFISLVMLYRIKHPVS